MIEAMLIDYLIKSGICGNDVFAEIPIEPPKKYIVIERTGGGDFNNISQALIAIRCVDTSLLGAIELSNALKEKMHNASDDINIYRAGLNSESNNTNTNTKEYRYLTTWDIKY